MVGNIVLIVVGLASIVGAGLARNRAFTGRRIAWHEIAAGGPLPQVLFAAGIALLAWGETQLQVRYWGGWAWSVLIPLALALWLPIAIHHRRTTEPGRPGRVTPTM